METTPTKLKIAHIILTHKTGDESSYLLPSIYLLLGTEPAILEIDLGYNSIQIHLNYIVFLTL